MKPINVSRLLVGLASLTLCSFVFASTGCASGSKQARDQDAEVGQPPAEGDPDSEPRTPPQGPDVDMNEGDEAGVAGQGDAAAPGDAPTVTPEQIESFMEKGPPYALTITRVEPHRINGAFAGFEIIAMHPSAERFLGDALMEGDVITHINGVQMKKPDDYLAAWKLLDDVDAVRIKFMREGDKEEAVWRVVDPSSSQDASTSSSQ
ncbi:MAG: hypothetical protein ACQEVA_03550 [Myxococcota bacterium]